MTNVRRDNQENSRGGMWVDDLDIDGSRYGAVVSSDFPVSRIQTTSSREYEIDYRDEEGSISFLMLIKIMIYKIRNRRQVEEEQRMLISEFRTSLIRVKEKSGGSNE